MKCTKKKHEFEGTNRKCFCGKADAWWFACSRCKEPNMAKILGSVCVNCENDPEYLKELKEYNNNWKSGGNRIKHYREATAFGTDTKTGRQYALDKRGRKFDPSETRYNLGNDSHGWKATDKVPKKKRIYI